jgi:hypothetical protein
MALICFSAVTSSSTLNMFNNKEGKRYGLCGLVVRVPGCRTEMYCASCDVRTEFIQAMYKKVDRLCGLVVRVPDYRTEMYSVSCEVRTELMYVV